MRFKGDTNECEDCGREISELDDVGRDDPLCEGCYERQRLTFIKEKCPLCNKPHGEKDGFYYCSEGEHEEEWAHISCVEKLPKEKQELWGEPDC